MTTRPVVEVMFSKYLPQPVKQVIKQGLKEGKAEANKFTNSIFSGYLGGVKQGFDSFVHSEAMQPNEIRAASNFDMFKSNVQSFFRNLGKSNEQGAQARQDLIMDLIITFLPVKAGQKLGTKAYEEASKIAGKAAKFIEKGELAAAERYITSATASLRNTMVKGSTAVKAKIEQGTQIIKGSIDDALKKITGGKDYQYATAQEVEELLSGKFADVPINTINKLSRESVDAKLAKLVKENAAALKALAEEVDVKSAKELPNLIKFTKQLGSIIENSPAAIRALASGRALGALANTGLSVYDLYQAYKEDGTLIPESIGANVGRVAAGLIGKNPITAILWSSLGYKPGEALTRVALKKLGVKEIASDIEQKEIEQGIRHPGLSAELPEFFSGQSGRKYHIVDDKIYAFDTGRVVSIKQALADADQLQQTQIQHVEEQLAFVNQQISDMEVAQQRGYTFSPEQIQQVLQERDTLEAQANSLKQTSFQLAEDYEDTDLDSLVQQVYNREVQPTQQLQELNKQQYLEDYNKLYEQVFNKIAQDTYNDLDSTYTQESLALAYLENQRKALSGQGTYLSPTDFQNYIKMAAMRQLAPEIRQQAANQMKSLEQAANEQKQHNLRVAQQQETERKNLADMLMNIQEQEETKRHNIAGEQTAIQKANADVMSAKAAAQNAQTNQALIPIKQQQAEANMKSAQTREAIAPFQQAMYAGQSLEAAQMSGIDLDTFINSNQSVMRHVFPEAFKESGGQPQVQQQQIQPQQSGLNQFWSNVKSTLGF